MSRLVPRPGSTVDPPADARHRAGGTPGLIISQCGRRFYLPRLRWLTLLTCVRRRFLRVPSAGLPTCVSSSPRAAFGQPSWQARRLGPPATFDSFIVPVFHQSSGVCLGPTFPTCVGCRILWFCQRVSPSARWFEAVPSGKLWLPQSLASEGVIRTWNNLSVSGQGSNSATCRTRRVSLRRQELAVSRVVDRCVRKPGMRASSSSLIVHQRAGSRLFPPENLVTTGRRFGRSDPDLE
jgi:hypothetical protein